MRSFSPSEVVTCTFTVHVDVPALEESAIRLHYQIPSDVKVIDGLFWAATVWLRPKRASYAGSVRVWYSRQPPFRRSLPHGEQGEFCTAWVQTRGDSPQLRAARKLLTTRVEQALREAFPTLADAYAWLQIDVLRQLAECPMEYTARRQALQQACRLSYK